MSTCCNQASSTGRGADQFMLRMPDGMRQQLKDLAVKSRRSMNAEVVIALDHWLKGEAEKNAGR